MPVITHRRTEIAPHAEEQKAGGIKHMVPLHQVTATQGKDSYYTIPVEPTAPTAAISSGKLIHFDLEPNEVGQVDDMYFRFKLSSSTAVQLLAGPFLVKEWYVKTKRGSGEEVARWYPEQIVGWVNMLPPKERQYWEKAANFKMTHLKSEGVNRFNDEDNLYVRSGDTLYIYLPVPWSIVHNGALDMHHVRHALRFYMRFESDFFVSGTAANVSLDAIDMVVRSPYEEPHDEQYRMEMRRKQPHSYTYLDVDRVEYNDKTLTASTEVKFSLDPLANQKAAFLQVCIKDGTSPTASDQSLSSFVPLTQNAQIDVETHGGKSLLGRGTAPLEPEIYAIWSNSVSTLPVKGMYFIPFTEDIKASMVGKIQGYRQFRSSNEQLVIDFPATGTAEVHTFTLTNAANDSGFYRLQLNGDSTSSLAFNDNAAAIKAAYEAIRSVAKRGWTVTASGAATATFTLTYGVRDGRISDEVGVPVIAADSLNDGGTAEDASSSVSTYGRSGWVSGSTYTTIIDSHYYKTLTIDEQGNIKCQTL